MSGSGIYKIQSICKPERAYIGSAVSFDRRWSEHLLYLRKGVHHSSKLQNHYDKYGKDDLVFTIIEPCLPQFLTDVEDTYLHPVKPYFNICPTAGNCLGRVFSKESILLMSKSHLGKATWNKGKKTGLISPNVFKKGEMTGEKNPFYGKHHSEESNQNNANAHQGKIPWNKGKTGVYSEETLKLIREARKLQVSPMKDKHHSEKSIQTMRDSWVIRKLKKAS